MSTFKSRDELDAMSDEIGRQIDQLYRAASHASRTEVCAGLTRATLVLAAPEDSEYVRGRLHAIFDVHEPPAPLAP